MRHDVRAMTHRFYALLVLGLTTVVVLFTAATGAQDIQFPSRPIRLIIPFSAGGSHDLHARALVSVAPNYIDQPIIVELKPGGTGAVASQFVASSRPDGHTLLFGAPDANTLVNQAQNLPYTKDSFIPVAMINYSPVPIMARADAPFKTFQEFVAYAKANPGKIRYGSAGVWGIPHVPYEYLQKQLGIRLTHVPYAGGGPALQPGPVARAERGIRQGDHAHGDHHGQIAEASAERRRIVARQLELVGLAEWAQRGVGELSGGMQQRVGLARAFATDADILLMDEPFSALDPLIRDRLQDELLALQARVRKTILFVSHDLDEALRLGDRISIMRHGRIVQTGTPQDIVLRPADDYVAEFVRRMNPLKVLTGAMVMRARERMEAGDGALFLDAARRYRLRLDPDGAAAELALDGAAHPLRAVEDEDACAEGERSVIVAPASISLQGLIHLRRRTGHPVLLAEGGHVLGVCGEAEIIAALAARNEGAKSA